MIGENPDTDLIINRDKLIRLNKSYETILITRVRRTKLYHM